LPWSAEPSALTPPVPFALAAEPAAVGTVTMPPLLLLRVRSRAPALRRGAGAGLVPRSRMVVALGT
jgi:hypothetical protein